ncbi:MAG: hypothetical protein WC205_04290 [Opitutaceae bacterium]|jgi:hypothetical protein
MSALAHVSKPSSVRRLAPQPVSLSRKMANLATAAVTVAVAKIVEPSVPVLVPEIVEDDRRAKCLVCPEGRWNAEGNAGLGECRHPDCGCTGLKLKFAALRCPLQPPEWVEWKPEGAS